MNALIIDDNAKSAAALEVCLKSTGFEQVHVSVHPYMVRSLLSIEEIDCMFIRVGLWDYRVFERIEQMPVVIFLSGGGNKLTDRSETTVPFKLKEPFVLSEVRQLIERIKPEVATQDTGFVFVRFSGRYHRIFISDIEMIERMKMNYVNVWTREVALLLAGTLQNWLEKLPAGKFIRVSDTLILPVGELGKIVCDQYLYKDRIIKLTFRFARKAKKEITHHSIE